MSHKDEMNKLLNSYYKGIYLLGELFPLIARITPYEKAEEILSEIPSDINPAFRKWVSEYPLEGGVPIGQGKCLEVKKTVILRLKELVEK